MTSFTDRATSVGELWFDVDFDAYVGGHFNRDLAGKGTLVVRDTEPRFRFSGRPRGKSTAGQAAVEFALRSEDIWNVLAEGNGVEFATGKGQSGERKKPFVFTCRSEREAAALLAVLPSTTDADFRAKEDFIKQMRELPAARGAGSVTHLLLFAIGAAFVFMGMRGAGWIQVESMEPYVRYGANNARLTTNGEWWRLVTCMFLHYGVIHLLLNGWALFQVGHLVERLFGRGLYALAYFGSGVTGSLATLIWNGPKVWSAGASGAVFGIYGALLGYLLQENRGVPAGIFRPMLQSALAFAGYNLAFGAMHPNIDNAAHIGGFIGGMALGWGSALPIERQARARAWPARAAAGVILAITLVAGGAVAAYQVNH